MTILPKSTPPKNASPKPLLAAPIRHALAIAAFIGGGWLGVYGGSVLAYAIAGWTERDIAELETMLIWSTLAGGLTGAIAGVWLALAGTRCSREAQQSALVAGGAGAIVGALLMLGTFDWPKSAGTPQVMYELRLPAGTPQPRLDRVNVILWSDKAGKGCYVSGLRRDGDRPVIAGSFLVTSQGDQTLSLGLDREPQGTWTMPIKASAKLDKAFGPWQHIEFTPIPREKVSPLPPGEYEVRYRVRKYL
jgi:hypothetical protein